MTKTGSNGDDERMHRRDRTEVEDHPRVVEDGGVERTATPSSTLQQSAGEQSESSGVSLREWTKQPDRPQAVIGVVLGISVLGTTAGLTGAVPPAVLMAVGTPLLFLTLLLLAVVLLRQATSRDSPSSSWANEGRPPIKRRP